MMIHLWEITMNGHLCLEGFGRKIVVASKPNYDEVRDLCQMLVIARFQRITCFVRARYGLNRTRGTG
jgi:hypothetical protein